MRIFFACPESHQFFSQLEKADAKNILLSYAYFKALGNYTKEARNWWAKNIVLDSGAFTVWTKQETIDIDRYIEFIQIFQEFKPEGVNIYPTNLDVLPGKFGLRPTKEEAEESARQGFENMEYIDSKGVDCIPVFHQHEDFKWLRKMADIKGYIGISPANDVSMKEKHIWLDKVFSFLKEDILKKKLKTHGYAVTGLTSMMRYPFFSVDSSSWVSGGKFGTVMSFKGGKFDKIHFRDKEQFSKMWNNLHIKNIDLMTDYKARNFQCIKNYQEIERFVTELWALRGITWN